MQAKSAKKTSKLYMTNGNSEKDSSFPTGSYDPRYVYEIKTQKGDIRSARIIQAVPLDKTDDSIPQTPASYKYYMNLLDFNRRMDQWVTVEKMKKTEMPIEQYKLQKKQKQDPNHDPNDSSEGEAFNAQNRKEHEEATKVKTIANIVFGKYKTETWYFSPFPEKYHNIECMYFCEFCLSFFVRQDEQERHMLMCSLVCPPGDQIYNDEEKKIAMFEVDSIKNPVYIENLGYLAKLFLDHKLLYYNLNLFFFYILTEFDQYGYHFVGYFSKSREINNENNLSCILVLPFFQKKGYGKFLINFSYELSVIEEKVGTPERPLSDLGRQSYTAYWIQRLIDYFRKLNEDQARNLTINSIAKETYIKESDIIDTLEKVKILKKVGDVIYLCLDKVLMDELYKKAGYPATYIHIDKIHWIPYRQKYDLEKMKI